MKKLESVLTRSQKKIFKKDIMVDGKQGRIVAEVSYDDACGNGHNSFAITGTVYSSRTSTADIYFETGGCIHEEIAKHFPNLAPYIKWHSISSDEPIHYVANTMYWARDRTHQDKEIGEAVAWDKRFKFTDFPFSFKEQEKGFWEYLENVGDFNNISVEAVPYTKQDGDYDFSDNYSLTGFIKENETKKWYKAPFKSKREADEFLEALRISDFEYVQTPTNWCEAVEPNLENARSSAIWEDATLEQLQNKQILMDRLPALQADFRNAVEELGFTF